MVTSIEKGDFLENVIQIVEKSLSGSNTKVEKKKIFIDNDGNKREIDIFIDTILHKRRTGIAIECKNHKSKIGIDKIEAYIQKCSKIPEIKIMYYVTTSDYQTGAIKAADKAGVTLCRLVKCSDENTIQKFNVARFITIIKTVKIKQLYLGIGNKLFFKNDSTTLVNYYNEVINTEQIENRIEDIPELNNYLIADKNYLIDSKKTVFLNIIPQNVFVVTQNKKKIVVDNLFLITELKRLYQEKKVEYIFKYVTRSDELAQIFSSTIDFDNEKVNFNIVENDGEKNFYMKQSNKELVKLEKLAKLEKFEINKKYYTNEFVSKFTVQHLKFGITEKAIGQLPVKEGSIRNLENKKHNSNKAYLMINPINKEINFMIQITEKSPLIFGRIPDPLSLMMSHCSMLCNKSIDFKHTIIDTSSNKEEDKATIKWNDGDYHKFLQYKMSCILMLKSAIEFFVNQCIPDSFELNGKSKVELIQQLSLLEKINKILPKVRLFSLAENENLISNIILIYDLSCLIQNMPTSDSINPPYLELIEKVTVIDLKECITLVTGFYEVNGYNLMSIDL